MVNRLHLEVLESSKDGMSRRVTRLTTDRGPRPVELFHEFDRSKPLSENTPLDGHVLAVFLYAARLGHPLVVHGALSRTAMRNFAELLLLWSRWRPKIYNRIEIAPDRVIDVPVQAGPAAAIAAFSGGADATFTALRHASPHGAPEAVRYPLRSVMMVHGFDVDIYNYDDFKRITARVRPLLESLGLEFRTMRTNSRDLRLQDWEDTAGLQLGACLSMHADEFRYGLVGSTMAYDELILPMGSCPVTDPLMSGDGFSVIHDGAGFSRTDKVAAILKDPIASRTLKVCWAGVDQAENCGRCEKCVRTQLNILAAGAKAFPSCFPGGLDLDCIRNIPIASACQISELKSIVAYARGHGVEGAWIPLVQQRINQWKPADAKARARQIDGGAVKQSVISALQALGIGEPIKKVWRRSRRAVLKGVHHMTDSHVKPMTKDVPG